MEKYLGCFLGVFLFVHCAVVPLSAQEPEFPPPATRTVVADVLVVEGEFIIVRGELGEIRIEVRDDTKISEAFTFGDRIKAVIRPNDTAISVERAAKDEPTGIAVDASPSAPPTASSDPTPNTSSTQSDPPAPPPILGPTTRMIVADLLMVDGDFYVVRGERGEIRIEATPDTKVTETFKFGDRIKAKVLPNDRAIFIERAKPSDVVGVQSLEPATPTPPPSAASTAPQQQDKSTIADTDTVDPNPEQKTKTITADVLMIDGDFIIVRGERGEIQIEVAPDTKHTEDFKFGDKIKAIVLPNNRALSVERAKPEDPIGMVED
ncbi:MAG: hypothetical protein MRJ96_14830 [Nitrospirales bacterium]|nr:hypothetical protein [Nitrospira sp.]MDR4502717.1 hypothetical protein [Nitrospirales bacterium]